MLKELPRTAEEEVAAARILEPFSNAISPLFHVTIPLLSPDSEISPPQAKKI